LKKNKNILKREIDEITNDNFKIEKNIEKLSII